MSRLIASAAVLAALGFAGYSWWTSSQAERRTREARDERIAAIKQEVRALASRHNADQDWTKRLAQSRSIRISPVMTAEIQELWLGPRPILFIGSTSDIVKRTSDSSTLLVDYGTLDQPYKFFGTELRIRVDCPNDQVQPVLSLKQAPNRFSLTSDTVVVAKIDSIEQSSERDADGNSTPVLTGLGRCLAVMAIQETIFTWKAPK